MIWTSEPPTQPGWYFVHYVGYRSRVERTEVWQLDFPDADSFLGQVAPDKLTRVEVSKSGDLDYFEIRFHADCGAPLWAGPIPIPPQPDPRSPIPDRPTND